MALFQIIFKFLDLLLIKTIFISVLIIIILKWIIKTLKTELALAIIKWILISYSILIIISLTFPFFTGENNEILPFINRATGPYYWAYFVMLFSAIVLPQTLLIKNLGKSKYFILIISILINAGMWFERFVIIVTSLHQDYFMGSEHYSILNLVPMESILVGLFWGILFLSIANINNPLWKKEDADIID
jgi:molybdopterin-containing oxidoreductase family membrane subunit